MNIGNYSLTYNNDSYEILYFIRNNDITLTSPDLIATDEDSSMIPSEAVLYLMIENSMSDFVPKMEMEVQDDNFSISNRLKTPNTRISVLVTKGSSEERLVFNLTFLVKDFKVTDMTPEHVTYHIWGELDNAIPLKSICEYATTCSLEYDNEVMENPYEIARSILSQVNYKLFPTEQVNSSGERIPSRYSLPYTNELCHFITYPNMKAEDAVKYLFSYAVGENGTSSPAYLVHNLINNKGYITTMEDIWRPSSIAQQPVNTQQLFSITQSPTPRKTVFAH